VVLREATYRRTGAGAAPIAHVLERVGQVRPELDGRLVRVEGKLLESATTSEHVDLTLQVENTVIGAALPRSTGDVSDGFVNGSRLAVTGVYEVKYDEFGPPSSFRIGPRSPADMTVLARAPWLNVRRMFYVGALLVVGIVLFMAWVAALRRRVERQTAQIRQQLQRETVLEAELQRATKLESLGLLAGGIAHDFNNLLTVVMGNLSLARLDIEPDAPPARCMREAEKAVVRARDLTQQLLTFAKGGAPVRTAVALPEVIREVAQFALSGANARCNFTFAEDPWPADVDKGQIGQVVQNIVINAAQAMPNGGRIDIGLQNETVGDEHGKMLAPGRYLRLSIRDHGAGVQPEDLRKIFDPYFTTKKNGMGLGLATVYSIIKKHAGHITVESTIGRGTVFDIWLPAANTVPDVAPATLAPVNSAPGRGRVLFMDDEEEIRRLGQAMLRHFGLDATMVADGAAAVDAYTRAMKAGSPYDVVILDLTVPGGVGGRQAMEQLLQLDPKVKAIVSSGYSNDQVLSNYRAHGFRGMVSKPYEISDFSHTISAVMQGAHS
jgi:signal transduction histidine kinase